MISDEFAQKIIELDEDTLKAQLAIQEQELANESTSRSASSLESLEEALIATPRGGFDEEIINAGDRLFQKLNVKAYQLMCTDIFDDQEIQTQFQSLLQENLGKVAGGFKANLGKLAGALTPILATNLHLAYPIAAILAALIIKTISSATAETICEVWKGKVNES
ncbi:conserved hypothetical protein [Planktothrix sp. PCC 11201]|uniref:hypothetical protein n=1 Tax=Planktothrix sp. PCC 11201 TaxID=1729650 RepID=UPI0009138334|nr:hypothetical protein [Planktothrix sp. PCC 11201]SKB13870.1 conserved hypothetical protein [Planktothrix sp. PCC 11201]